MNSTAYSSAVSPQLDVTTDLDPPWCWAWSYYRQEYLLTSEDLLSSKVIKVVRVKIKIMTLATPRLNNHLYAQNCSYSVRKTVPIPGVKLFLSRANCFYPAQTVSIPRKLFLSRAKLFLSRANLFVSRVKVSVAGTTF